MSEKPIFTEKELALLVVDAVKSKFIKELDTGYSNPMDEFIRETINKHKDLICNTLNNLLIDSLASNEFKQTLQEEFNRKIAKTLISKLSGGVEKSVNEIMMNAETKAKLILAITNIVK